MLTVLESLKLSAEYLEKKDIENPRINAELLLSHVLNCKRLDLYLSFERQLSDDEIALYRQLLKRRGMYEPLQYIIGSVEFYGLKILVNESVLIPRPETELLVEEVINSSDKEKSLNILDIGTGSGNIVIALAKNLSMSKITGVDISDEALLTANENAALNGVTENTIFLKRNILNDFQFDEKYDVVVSNPPYVSVTDFKDLRPELRLHEPRVSLTDDSDGYIFYKTISSSAKNYLKPGGKLFLEIGMGQSEAIKIMLEENGFKDIVIIKDYAKIDRIIKGVLI
ncbi:MAG: peptide chain release factor N(5)-glutamine methyltransferase [Ignavibacteriaceae bacterium]|nr:peptide chain release factor N(5)-glutamine methyltransferase [Ignavibacteriaceae bacterium]